MFRKDLNKIMEILILIRSRIELNINDDDYFHEEKKDAIYNM